MNSLRYKNKNWYLYQLIPTTQLRTIFLNTSTTVIGRIIGADIRLNSNQFSRLQCSISINNGEPFLHNHGQWDIFVNDIEISPYVICQLNHKDIVTIPSPSLHPGFTFQVLNINSIPQAEIPTEEPFSFDENMNETNNGTYESNFTPRIFLNSARSFFEENNSPILDPYLYNRDD